MLKIAFLFLFFGVCHGDKSGVVATIESSIDQVNGLGTEQRVVLKTLIHGLQIRNGPPPTAEESTKLQTVIDIINGILEQLRTDQESKESELSTIRAQFSACSKVPMCVSNADGAKEEHITCRTNENNLRGTLIQKSRAAENALIVLSKDITSGKDNGCQRISSITAETELSVVTQFYDDMHSFFVTRHTLIASHVTSVTAANSELVAANTECVRLMNEFEQQACVTASNCETDCDAMKMCEKQHADAYALATPDEDSRDPSEQVELLKRVICVLEKIIQGANMDNVWDECAPLAPLSDDPGGFIVIVETLPDGGVCPKVGPSPGSADWNAENGYQFAKEDKETEGWNFLKIPDEARESCPSQ